MISKIYSTSRKGATVKIAENDPKHEQQMKAEIAEWKALLRTPAEKQLDRYGVALMMIREGCANPADLAKRVLAEFGK